MTRSQTHQEYLASLKFHSLSSICTWAGKPQEWDSIGILDNDNELPYIEKDGVWYYFGLYPEREYRLVCTAMNDLGAENG